MPASYFRRHGHDWPLDLHPIYVDLIIAKKWREFPGIHFPDPHVRLLDAARALLPPDAFKISSLAEEHAYDFVNYQKVVTWGSASCGKAQPLDAVVMTPSGPRTMGDIAVGDEVCVPDGGVATVVRTHDVGVEDEYEVGFSGGVSARCAADHRWEVRMLQSGLTRTLTTLDLATRGQKRDISIGLTAPVQFNPVSVDMDPYLLGALLGDGYFGGAAGRHNLRFCSADEDILECVREAIGPGYHLAPLCERPYDFCIARDGRGRYPAHRFKAALRKYGLWGKCGSLKFVPREYKYASVPQRLALLQGLMDTDGSCSRGGCAKFTSSSRQLVSDVAEIVHSLGGKAVPRKPYRPKLPGKPGEHGLLMYTVGVTLPDMGLVFRCARKRERALVGKTTGRLTRRTLKFVRKTGRRVPMKCITIDHPRHVYLTDNCIITKNSNDYGLYTVLHWITDPLHTVCLVGSTTLGDLKSRTWESIVRYHGHLKNNAHGFDIPGVFSKTGYAIYNVADEELPETLGSKASIQGRALNEGGRLQGAHLPYVLVLVDELATISSHADIKVAMANLRVGAKDFRFYGLANPEEWSDPSCQYCIPAPPMKLEDVTPDTGTWESTFGFRVRHHDGLKSPCVVDPSLVSEYPFLMKQEDVDENLKEADGNQDSPVVWKMTRGFPRPASASQATVIDMATVSARSAGDPYAPSPVAPSHHSMARDHLHTIVAGCDPAWSASGDSAIWQVVDIVVQMGVPMLCFRPPERLPIAVSSPRSPVEQLTDGVLRRLMDERNLDPRMVAYDASGNQALGDVVSMRTGGLAGLGVNNSVRASDLPIRTGSPQAARDQYYDRGSESWAVLAEFIRAGQVRGLSPEAIRQITTRRWQTKSSASSTLSFPLRMEPKEAWAARHAVREAKSPNECDAAALAALAAKERAGIVPWASAVPELTPAGGLPGNAAAEFPSPLSESVPEPDYGGSSSFDFGGYSESLL